MKVVSKVILLFVVASVDAIYKNNGSQVNSSPSSKSKTNVLSPYSISSRLFSSKFSSIPSPPAAKHPSQPLLQKISQSTLVDTTLTPIYSTSFDHTSIPPAVSSVLSSTPIPQSPNSPVSSIITATPLYSTPFTHSINTPVSPITFTPTPFSSTPSLFSSTPIPQSSITPASPISTPTPLSSTPTPPFHIDEEYRLALAWVGSFIEHTEQDPSTLPFDKLKQHVRAFFTRFDVAALTARVSSLAPMVTTPNHAHALYILLDMCSAVAALSHSYMNKVQARINYESSLYPKVPGRHLDPFLFLSQGFRRHEVKLKAELTRLYRKALSPGGDGRNVYFPASYTPGTRPSLDALMGVLKVPVPFVELDNRWYHILPADDTNQQLVVWRHNHLWQLQMASTTDEDTMADERFPGNKGINEFAKFRFLDTGSRRQYSLVNAGLPNSSLAQLAARATNAFMTPKTAPESVVQVVRLNSPENNDEVIERTVSPETEVKAHKLHPKHIHQPQHTEQTSNQPSTPSPSHHAQKQTNQPTSPSSSHHVLVVRGQGGVLFVTRDAGVSGGVALVPRYPGSAAHWLIRT